MAKPPKSQTVALRIELLEVMPLVWRRVLVPGNWTLANKVRDLPLPICVAGENACPPEDVGGPHGYARFLEIQ